MRVTIEYDMSTTKFPTEVSLATQQLLMASRGFTVGREPSVTEENTGDGQTDETPQQAITRKRGRRSNAEKAAEAQAAQAEEVVAEPVPEAEKVAIPDGPAPAMFVVNPVQQQTGGLTGMLPFPSVGPTPLATVTPFPTNFRTGVQAQQPAMPSAEPPVIGPDGNTLIDLQAIMSLANQKQAGTSFQYLRRRTWLDGSPKDPWLVAENVPVEHRERVMTEMAQVAGL